LVERTHEEVMTSSAPSQSYVDFIAELCKQPGGRELCKLAEARRGEVALIGGAVRDMLLARTPRELDVVVEEDAHGFAADLARELQVLAGEEARERFEATFHGRFRTALVRWPGGQIDVATRRSEHYPHDGALPDVADGTLETDLQRRDFTINALFVALNGPRRGQLDGASNAREDLEARVLRVLHERSFRDDPTRLLRMARYRARLGFAIEPHTAELAAEAIAVGALDTVSAARVGAELRLALGEPDPVAVLDSLAQLGVLSALHQSLTLDAALARAALDVLPPPPDAWPDVLLLAALLLPSHSFDTTNYETRLRVLLDGWEVPAAERERVVHSAILAPRLAARLARAERPSEIYEIAHGEPLEAVALAAALAEADANAEGSDVAAAAARRWLAELRFVELEIGGDELLAAGIAAGPDVGRRLRRALMRKLDGELSGRDAELREALKDA
jgi:tRNA nucleotidyltransferase (CCA-adding enzyme)